MEQGSARLRLGRGHHLCPRRRAHCGQFGMGLCTDVLPRFLVCSRHRLGTLGIEKPVGHIELPTYKGFVQTAELGQILPAVKLWK